MESEQKRKQDDQKIQAAAEFIKRHYDNLKSKAERQHLLQQMGQASTSDKSGADMKLEILLNMFLDKEKEDSKSDAAKAAFKEGENKDKKN